MSRALPGGQRGSATAREAVKRIDALERAINGQSTAGTSPGLIAAQTGRHYADPHHPSRLNDIDPNAWLSDVLPASPIYSVFRLLALLPWEWRKIRAAAIEVAA